MTKEATPSKAGKKHYDGKRDNDIFGIRERTTGEVRLKTCLWFPKLFNRNPKQLKRSYLQAPKSYTACPSKLAEIYRWFLFAHASFCRLFHSSRLAILTALSRRRVALKEAADRATFVLFSKVQFFGVLTDNDGQANIERS